MNLIFFVTIFGAGSGGVVVPPVSATTTIGEFMQLDTTPVFMALDTNAVFKTLDTTPVMKLIDTTPVLKEV